MNIDSQLVRYETAAITAKLVELGICLRRGSASRMGRFQLSRWHRSGWSRQLQTPRVRPRRNFATDKIIERTQLPALEIVLIEISSLRFATKAAAVKHGRSNLPPQVSKKSPA
jgi:hypothetical protein